jgi:hypothetical protein
MTEKTPLFVQSLHKMKTCNSSKIWHRIIDFIDVYDFPTGRPAKLSSQLWQLSIAARRFDWPAFLRALGNRPDKSPQWKPSRSRTHRAFLKSRDSTAVPSAPISETPVQCGRKLASDFILRYVFLR